MQTADKRNNNFHRIVCSKEHQSVALEWNYDVFIAIQIDCKVSNQQIFSAMNLFYNPG